MQRSNNLRNTKAIVDGLMDTCRFLVKSCDILSSEAPIVRVIFWVCQNPGSQRVDNIFNSMNPIKLLTFTIHWLVFQCLGRAKSEKKEKT